VEDTILITGVDSKYFLMACLLYQSLKPTSLAKNFFILDFGLQDEEKAFFKSKGILVDTPAREPADAPHTHPWALKAMLYDYVGKLSPVSNIIWIDSDIVVNPNFGAALRNLLDGMASNDVAVAASPEMIISDFMVAFAHLAIGPFIRAHAARKIPFMADYYNSGFIVFRSMVLLREWGELAKSTPFHEMFDQNLFNLLLHGGIKVQALPRSVWNYHGSDFEDHEADGADPMVLHVTSHRAPLHYRVYQCGFAGSQSRRYELRLLIRKHFLDRQFTLLEQFVSSEQAALCACNLLPARWPDGKFFVVWNLPSDLPCPCKSGKSYEHCHGLA
jgi:lipopolysaccharide biosynthesis glycosyltransferase